MFIYNLGYHTYEESEYIQLYHNKKFNKKEFEKIVIKATITILKKYEIKSTEIVTFQDILYDVVEELIKNFGFKKVKFSSEFNVFGWANILNEKDWEYNRDEQLNKLTKAVKKELLKKTLN